ncbi:MAG: lipid II flippase MurJ [Thermomicrobiales bacterium]
MRRAHLRPQPGFDRSMPEIREIGQLYLPVFLGLIVSAIVVIVDRNLAWRAETDAVGAMRYATTLAQLVLGLVAAVSLAVLPQLSYHHANDDDGGFRDKLVQALSLITVLLIPAVVGMAVLAKPIVALLFEHGETGPEGVPANRGRIAALPPGHLLAGYDQVLIFSFYARKNTLLPVATVSSRARVTWSSRSACSDRYQMRGLVAANSVQFAVHTALMFWFGRSFLGRTGFSALGSVVARAGLASMLMGGLVWSVWRAIERRTVATPGAELDRCRCARRCRNLRVSDFREVRPAR